MNKIEKITDSLYRLKNKLTVLKSKKNGNKQDLRKNLKYKGAYSGKRCFIMGNGPSLKQQDLTLLHDEYVFTVNQAVRNQHFKDIKSDFHFWVDVNFFDIDKNNPEDMELLNTMKMVNEVNKDTQNFFPIDKKGFVEEFGLDKCLNVNYFYPILYLTETSDIKTDFTKPVTVFGTVVQECIIAAMYMGFSEIYLLGCDNTSLMVTLKSALKSNDNDDYAYEITENEKKRMENLIKKNGIEEYTRSYLDNLKAYRILGNQCQKNGIKLVNCSAQTVIDSIPREKYEDVIARKKA